MKSKSSSEEERTMLFEAGWEMQVRGGLIVWRRPDCMAQAWCAWQLVLPRSGGGAS